MLGYGAGSSSAARTANLSSALQVTVEPAQSSFFAGEEFACTIVFTNTRTPLPQTQPLPARPTFESAGGEDAARRSVSTEVPSISYPQSGRADPTSSSALNRTSSSALPSSFRPLHRKSQSVDIRTFARRNQLARDQLLDTEASDEQYYRTLSASNSFAVEDDNSTSVYAQTLLDNLPGRRHLIGKKVADPSSSVRHATSDHDQLPKTPSSKHQKSYSIAVPGERQSEQDRLGIGHPMNGSTPSKAAFASPRIPSHRVPLDARVQSAASSRAASSSSSAKAQTPSGSRKPSGPIAASHPHSRKRSVAQFQAEDLSATFEIDNVGNSVSNDGDESFSTSTLSPRTSLDKRDRNGNNTAFYGVGDNSTMESVLREDITKMSQADASGSQQGKSSRQAQSNGSETILWTFAQFGGHFQVDESLIKPGEFEQVKERLSSISGGSAMMAAGGTSLAAFGGGEFGNSVEGEGDDRQANKSWGSYLRSAISYGGGKSKSSANGGHRRNESTLLSHKEKMMSSRTIPVLSNPPTMIAVDVTLAPGESRSFTLRVPLPPDLPPSYIGKAISFQYLLTLGTNRLALNRAGGVEQKSRLVRIPMRIYNHVNMTGVTAFYDLTNPIVNVMDNSSVIDEQEGSSQGGGGGGGVMQNGQNQRKNGVPRKRRSSSKAEAIAEASFLQYTRELLQSCTDRNEMDAAESQDADRIDADLADLMARKSRIHDLVKTSPNAMRTHLILPPTMSELYARRGRRRSDAAQAGLGLASVDDDDAPKSNSQAVELLSRNAQKVSYDISKDGQVAATLTLIKSKYRLGDVVMGVVSINAADSIAKVVRVAATLETHEEIEATLATLPAGRVQKLTRIVHASCHDSTLDAGQAHFSLPIPSGATPNFETSAVRLNWTIRLAFLTQSCVRRDLAAEPETTRQRPAPHLVAAPEDGFAAYHRAFRAVSSLAGPSWVDSPSANGSEVKLEVVECAVPLTVLPHSTRFNAGEVAFIA